MSKIKIGFYKDGRELYFAPLELALSNEENNYIENYTYEPNTLKIWSRASFKGYGYFLCIRLWTFKPRKFKL